MLFFSFSTEAGLLTALQQQHPSLLTRRVTIDASKVQRDASGTHHMRRVASTAYLTQLQI
ncbi:hypothetical protein [Aureliella helgolandensis]|nr:hypothetical protein [Aureliella helgolandensis]